MIKNWLLNFSLFITVQSSSFPLSLSQSFEYPVVKRTENVVDDYFGTNITGPYRWLEDLNSEETKTFIEQQNNLTFSYLEKFGQRDEIHKNLRTLWNFTDTESIRKAGQRYFFFSKTGEQNQSVYYYKDSYDGPASIAIDPSTFPNANTASLVDGTNIPSHDGQLISYGISYAGVDWYTLHFKNVASGEIFPEVLTDIKLSDLIWTPDNSGILYSKYDINKDSSETDNLTKKRQNIYYHKIGTNQSEDILVVEFPKHASYLVGYNNVHITAGGKYLILTPFSDAPNNFVWFANIENGLQNQFQNGKLDLKPLEATGSSIYVFLANLDSTLYFLTSRDASNRHIVSIDLEKIPDSSAPEDDAWKIIVPEHNSRLDWAFVPNKNILVVSYLKDVKSTMELRNLSNGTLIKQIPLENGFLSESFHIHGNSQESEFYFRFSSYLTPGKVFRINFKNTSLEPELISENIISGYNSLDYEATQVFYSSKDGTKIPMHILHKRNYVPKGDSPCLLNSYGGFGANVFSNFQQQYIYFLSSFNGIVALPSIRGGGEYGEKWHEDGKHHKKQNSFDDFAAAAEYLIRENYTERSKLTIEGHSNGGLLIAASITQRPDLFGAAIPRAGVMDMLRFLLLTDLPHVIAEYGSADNIENFQTLIKYSPLHNVRLPENETVQYPATLVVTGGKDDRVLPYNSYKFTAELQYTIGKSKRQTEPLILRVDHDAGHGAGQSTAAAVEEWTDIFSFIAKSLNLTVTAFKD